jgi:hypothetical protein
MDTPANDETPIIEGSYDMKKKKKIKCLSIGSIINYSVAVDFAAIFIACLVVVGCIGTIQTDLNTQYAEKFNTTHVCYMFATIGEGSDQGFNTITTKPCDGAMVGFSFIALMSVIFIVLLIVKGIFNCYLNWTLYIEIPVLVILILIEFALSVMISIGNDITCNSIKNYLNKPDCNGTFPNATFVYAPRAYAAQSSAWFIFLFMIIAIVIYFIRLILCLRRRRKRIIRNTLANESFNDDNNLI